MENWEATGVGKAGNRNAFLENLTRTMVWERESNKKER